VRSLIGALSCETSMYREVIWHPDVTARMDAAVDEFLRWATL
jgi:hypothetical protein